MAHMGDNHPQIRAGHRNILQQNRVGVLQRTGPDKRRPLASTRAQLEQLYALRQSAYAQAHLRLDGSGAPIGELADRVVDWLGS